jgi:uncharacterized membrane protein
MNEFIESVRSILDRWGELLEVILNGLSLFSIILGIILSLVNVRKRYREKHAMHTIFRYRFGGWLIVALELQLAADIASTIVSPSTQHLIELGAIALIRTFLNYFLSKELKEEKEVIEEKMETKKE